MNLPSVNRWTPLLAALEHGLLERQTAVRALLLAALAGEHVLLIGPPGTAKSELARRLHRVIAGAGYFERLLTRFSTPEELFGPLSLKALEDDRYERLTAGFLPTAGIAFLDEVFKANSAILNALLTLLNEREFDNGAGRECTPLVSVVGASNEVPADDALLAFYDRFLLRVPVAPVGDASFAPLLHLGSGSISSAPGGPTDSGRGARSNAAPAVAPLTPAERAAVADAAAAVALSPAAESACVALRGWLAARGQPITDRRWVQWIALMRIAAASEGRREVDELDLWLAPYVAAATPQDVGALARWFEADLLGAVEHDAPWLTRAVEAFEQQLQIEQSAPDEADTGGAAGKLALARAIGGPGADAEASGSMMRIVSSRLEEQLRRRYSSVHITARCAQIDEVLASLAPQIAELDERRTALARRLAGRVWLPPGLAQRLLGAHERTLATLRSLDQRLRAAREAFAALPLDPKLEGPVPAPVLLEAAHA